MNTTGRHLLAEYRGCDLERLNDVALIEALMRRAAIEAGATIVQSAFHEFAPQGVSGVVVVEESHLSIHTWPEVGYAAVDFYTCGECSPERAHEVLTEGLMPDRFELMVIERGRQDDGSAARSSMAVRRHFGVDASDSQGPRDSQTASVTECAGVQQ